MPEQVGPAKPAHGSVDSFLASEILGFLRKRTAAVAGVVLTGIVASLAYYADSIATEYMLSRIKKELSNENSDITKEIMSAVLKSVTNNGGGVRSTIDSILKDGIRTELQSKVGDLSAGHISLFRTTPSHTMYLYAPVGHRVVLHLKISDLGEENKVVLLSPSSRNITFSKDGFFKADVTDLLRAQATRSIVDNVIDIEPEQGQFKDIYALRFQLKSKDESSIFPAEIDYLMIVTPTISATQ